MSTKQLELVNDLSELIAKHSGNKYWYDDAELLAVFQKMQELAEELIS